jgi:L-ascorbate metabolism protein UlaG (beta-lactamase superfamily)
MPTKPPYPLSDHYDGKTFSNPWGVNNSKTLWDVFKWKITTTAQTWPTAVQNTVQPQLVKNGSAASIHVTSIGHATVYIQDSKRSILTDPQFSLRASPVGFAGPSRIRKPALQIEELPSLDTVIISHNHYDHLDLPSLVALEKRFHPQFIVPLGNAKLLRDSGIQNIIELDWWESHHGVQLVPAQHWSARGVADRNEALWGGYVLTLSNKKIFFAGDTGYGPHFKMIHEKCGAMDLSLLPIGAYEPRWFMKDQHMNPDDAVMAHLDLRSKQSLAIHFETFQLTDEAFDEPRKHLAQALKERQVPDPDFVVQDVGATLILK